MAKKKKTKKGVSSKGESQAVKKGNISNGQEPDHLESSSDTESSPGSLGLQKNLIQMHTMQDINKGLFASLSPRLTEQSQAIRAMHDIDKGLFASLSPRLTEQSQAIRAMHDIDKGLFASLSPRLTEQSQAIRAMHDIDKGLFASLSPRLTEQSQAIRAMHDINKGLFASLSPRLTEQFQAIHAMIDRNKDLFRTRGVLEGIKMDSERYERIFSNREKVTELETQYYELRKKYDAEKADKKTLKKQLEKKEKELIFQTKITSLMGRVSSEAGKKIEKDPDFLGRFNSVEPQEISVISIDIRRSTDMMLKAKTANDFANFIGELSEGLKNIIIDNFGVFDKFTGDGILAFFPTFYSGKHAVYHAIIAAEECHEYFVKYYIRNRSKFNAVRLDTGLGIGIDHGLAHISSINGDHTVIGQPVVYACRLSSAPPNTTLLNQGAYDAAIEGFSDYKNVTFVEHGLDLKHEGRVLAYQPQINWEKIELERPDWCTP